MTALVLAGAVAMPAGAEDHLVYIQGFSFDPDVVTIKGGDSVTWTGQTATHTVTAADGSFDSGFMSGDFTHTFYEAGTVEYYCKQHLFRGEVVVETSATPPPTSTPPPPPPSPCLIKIPTPLGDLCII